MSLMYEFLHSQGQERRIGPVCGISALPPAGSVRRLSDPRTVACVALKVSFAATRPHTRKLVPLLFRSCVARQAFSYRWYRGRRDTSVTRPVVEQRISRTSTHGAPRSPHAGAFGRLLRHGRQKKRLRSPLRVKLGPRDSRWLMSGSSPKTAVEQTSVDGSNVPGADLSSQLAPIKAAGDAGQASSRHRRYDAIRTLSVAIFA
jgi:hypothetical protein